MRAKTEFKGGSFRKYALTLSTYPILNSEKYEIDRRAQKALSADLFLHSKYKFVSQIN